MTRFRFAMIVLAVIALAGLAGCGAAGSADDLEVARGPRSWIFQAERVDGSTFTVAVTDKTGRIDEATVDPVDAPQVAAVANPPGEPNVVIVPWTGGACDTRTTVSVENAPGGAGILVRIRTEVAPGVCDTIGVAHSLRLASARALPAAGVTLTTER